MSSFIDELILRSLISYILFFLYEKFKNLHFLPDITDLFRSYFHHE